MSSELQVPVSDDTSEGSQIFGWWCGIVFFSLFIVATLLLMKFVPPPSALLSGEELVAKVSENILMLRGGAIIGVTAAFFIIPWSVMVAIQISRLEGRYPVFAITAFGLGVANAVAFFIPYMFWAGTFYRLDRAPELIKLINDISWLEWIMTVQPTVLQLLCIGIAGLVYKGSRDVYPRWFSYLNLWAALLFCPGMIAVFFKDGPFAWDGIFCFWLPVISFCIYFPISLVVFRRGIRNHKYDS